MNNLLTGLSPRIKQMALALSEGGIPAWRLKQVISAIYGEGNGSCFTNLTGVPRDIGNILATSLGRDLVSSLEPVHVQEADYAKKVLFRCVQDDSKIEAVALAFHNHTSLCISSQVGCAFACSFCATGKIGLKRHLTADEIADQVLYFKQTGVKVDSISFMGMGEPLGNPRIFDAINCITHDRLLGFASRRLNVSTIGIVPGILKLTDMDPQINLAFSLHSPYPTERERLMPIQKIYPAEKVFDALDAKLVKHKRRIWLAYLLLKDVNDSPEHARELARIIKSRPDSINYLYHVNILPYNEGRNVAEKFENSAKQTEFEEILKKRNISTSFRNSFGRSIDAACGQLYAEYEAKSIKM